MVEHLSLRLPFVVFFAALFWLGGFFYLRHERGALEGVYLANQTSTLNMTWQCVVNSQQIGMQAYFDSYVMQPGVLEILHRVQSTEDEGELAIQRALLYRHLYPAYEQLRQREVRQFHFHTPDLRSFLRFHAPHLSGDSLAAGRPSVVMAHQERKVVQGFETGRVLAGYRSVFPIIDGGEVLGSVEFGQPFETFRCLLEKVGKASEFLLVYDAALLLPKLFDEQKRMYEPSLFSRDWLVEDAGRRLADSPPVLSESARKIYSELAASPAFIGALASKQPQSLAISGPGGFHRVSMLPIVDPEGLPAVLLFALSAAPELDEIHRNHRFYLLVFSAMIVFGVFVVFLFLRNRDAIVAKKRDFQLVANAISDGLYVMDEQGGITFVNDSAARLLGYSRAELLGMAAHDLFHVNENGKAPLSDCSLCNVFRYNTRFRGEEVFCRQDGSSFVAEVASEPLLEHGKGVSAVTIFRDITERKRMEEQLHDLCNTDPLTRAFNRRYFLEVLDNEVQRSRRYQTPFALVMGDVDRFKRINDVFGHQAGDRALQGVVAAIQDRIRASDVFARWGGEEFVLLLAGTSLDNAVPLVETIRANIRALNIEEVGTVTISFGVTVFRADDTIDTLLSRVDSLLYAAKAAGRNCVKASP